MSIDWEIYLFGCGLLWMKMDELDLSESERSVSESVNCEGWGSGLGARRRTATV